MARRKRNDRGRIRALVVGALPAGAELRRGPKRRGPAKQGGFLNDQGYQYYRQSRFNVAAGKFSEALKINRLIDRREGIAANLNNLGVIARSRETRPRPRFTSGRPWRSIAS